MKKISRKKFVYKFFCIFFYWVYFKCLFETKIDLDIYRFFRIVSNDQKFFNWNNSLFVHIIFGFAYFLTFENLSIQIVLLYVLSKIFKLQLSDKINKDEYANFFCLVYSLCILSN